MTDQGSRRMDDTAAQRITIITVVIQSHPNSAPGSDETEPTDALPAEPRTRQEHAAADPAGTSAMDG
jgi:hypothetical protein